MTLEQVDRLVGPLSNMATNGVVHFDMAGKADYLSAYYTDATCELVFKCKLRESKSAAKTLETTDSRLISWKRK